MNDRYILRLEDKYRQMLVDTATGRDMHLDGGEPEDQNFARDWAWVPVEMNKLADVVESYRKVHDSLITRIRALESEKAKLVALCEVNQKIAEREQARAESAERELRAVLDVWLALKASRK